MHDENYKRIFAFPRVIEDLLRAFVPGDWLQEVNFATLRKLSTEYINDELLKRHGDNVWRMRLRKNWLYLLLLVEFQSTDDPLMALRIHTYTGLLYQELALATCTLIHCSCRSVTVARQITWDTTPRKAVD